MDAKSVLLSYEKNNYGHFLDEAGRNLKQAEKTLDHVRLLENMQVGKCPEVLTVEMKEVEELLDMIQGREEIQNIYIIHEVDEEGPVIEKDGDIGLACNMMQGEWIGIKVKVVTKLITPSRKIIENYKIYEGMNCWGFDANDKVNIKEGEDEEVIDAINGCSGFSESGIKGYENIDVSEWRKIFEGKISYLDNEFQFIDTIKEEKADKVEKLKIKYLLN